MAEITDKQESQRTKLEEVVPLETPFELQLAVASVCNFRCNYCPCSRPDLLKKNGVKKGVMDFELYKKVIDDLAEFPQTIKILRLVKEGEPLLNKRFVDMVSYAKEKQPEVKIDTTTNAILLTPKLSDAIISVGLDKIFISLQGINAQAFKKIAHVDIDFDKLLENVIYFCENRQNCRVYIKVPDVGLNKEEKEQFFEMFDKYADELFVEHIIPTWPDFDISHVKKDDGVGLFGNQVEDKWINVCPIIFYNLNVDFDGSIPPCQLDWAHKTVLGNVKNKSLFNVWNGKVFNDLRRLHLRNERHLHPLCGKCEALQFCRVDKIDEFAEGLLQRFESLP